MCARDLRPISIVNGEGFIDFCRELNPSYDVPGPSTVSTYFTKMYTSEKSELLNVLSMQTGVALTSDHWTSLATEGYITVTCHFIDEGKHKL